VPGSVRGFEMAVTKYGKRTWAQNMAPAVELASKGFPVSYALAEGLKGSRSLASSPESKRIFQKNGAFYEVGETLVQPELAQTLERISKNGASEFYEGETAKRFADEMSKHGGIISLAISRTTRRSSARRITGNLQELHDHHVAAIELRRHRAARDAGILEAPATKRRAPDPRRRSTTRPRRCAAPTPTATSMSAIPTS
jgi:Gamma-glutamyltransferase